MSLFADLSKEQQAELWSCLALRHARGVGPQRSGLLTTAFGSAFAAVDACLRSPTAWAGLVPAQIAHDFAARQWREPALEEWRSIQAGGFAFLLSTDPEYPALLREIPDPPLLLYYKGAPSLLRGPAVGVVGARACSPDGMTAGARLASGLSRVGVTVVSGMARGIDRVAHLGGLQGPGRSVGVLGTGIDLAYPPENGDLFRLMEKDGLLLSEFPPGSPASPGRFPVRNRIISGLCRGVLVVEAAERSGSLITARLAVEQNREVFVVPGHMTAAVSAGCRDLVRRGARPVFAVEDILLELAPFLAEDLRAAMSRETPRAKGQARRPAEALHVQMAEGAEPLLWGDLPAKAPVKPPGGRKRKAAAGSESQVFRDARLEFLSRPESFGNAPARVLPVFPEDLSNGERAVLESLAEGAVHMDVLCRRLGLEPSGLSGMLLMLEMRALVERLPGAFYRLV